MLPGFSRIGDETRAFQWFVVVDVPLYVFLLWLITANDDTRLDETATLWLNGFFVVHSTLHLVLYDHPHNQFRGILWYVLIVGAGLCGLVGLLTR